MPMQNWWVFKDERTNPGKYHRTGGDGLPVGTAEILREGDVDLESHDQVDFIKVTPTHLDSQLGRRIMISDPGWRESLWGPNGEWLGPHGILFVWENEYPDPHAIFAALLKVETDGPPAGTKEVTQEVDTTSAPATSPLQDFNAPSQDFDPRDANKDGVVDKHEKKQSKK